MAIIAESEVLEAIAQYDFTARSSREVSHDDDDDSDLMRPLCAVAPAEIVIMAAEEEINETLTVTGKDISQ